MNAPVILLIFCAAVYVTLRNGPARAFAAVLVPTLLLGSSVTPVGVPLLPDVSPIAAVSYGAVLGCLLRGTFPLPARLHPIDGLVALLALLPVVSAYANNVVWTAASEFGVRALEWVVPYLLARACFLDVEQRRAALRIACACAVVVACCGLIEFRLWPYWTTRTLESLHVSQVANGNVLGRFGFFRAASTFVHPIDLGNVGVLTVGLILALAAATGARVRESYLLTAGLGAAGLFVVTSGSFTSFLAVLFAGGAYVALRRVGSARALLVPGAVLGLVGIYAFTLYVVGLPRRTNEELGARLEAMSALDASRYVREMIVQRTWPVAAGAGAFGYGQHAIRNRELDLDSVDNSYLLFAVRYGWAFVAAWGATLVAASYFAARALGRLATPQQRAPIAALIAVLLGVAAGMYTVWFGFAYAPLWVLTLGTLVSACQLALGEVSAVVPPPQMPAALPGGRGFPVVVPRPVAG